MAATTISRSGIGTDDDGSGTTGTVINAAYVGLIYDNIDAIFSGANGITLNQAGNDGRILQFESSDVAHGITALIETSAYGFFIKQSATQGGLLLRTATEGTVALQLQGFATTDNTTKSTSATAHIDLYAATKSGTGVTGVGADGNMVTISNGGTVRFIFDSEGDGHADVSWTTFDAHDDVSLLTSLEGALAGRDALREGFHAWMTYNREELQRSKLVTFNEDGHHFVNFTRLSMALCGAVRQLAERCAQQDARLLAIEGR